MQQVGAPAAALPPRTNVLEMGRYLAQNGISVEQVGGLPPMLESVQSNLQHQHACTRQLLLAWRLWSLSCECMCDMAVSDPEYMLCQPSRGLKN